ncbi:MAG TPA: hypothetical protein VMV72_08485 [Verrucomicrobiae bacterium]|nr:hypothetical protein [Verrucomicrobiae bacterium]
MINAVAPMADSRSSSAPIHWSNFSNLAINLRDLSFVEATTYKLAANKLGLSSAFLRQTLSIAELNTAKGKYGKELPNGGSARHAADLRNM